MAGVVKFLGLGGTDKATKLARQEAAAAQRRAMAALANQQAQTDREGMRGGRTGSRRLLTFAGADLNPAGASGL